MIPCASPGIGPASRLVACIGNGGGRIVSKGVTVGGRLSGSCILIASSRLCNGSDGSCIGESRLEWLLFLGVTASPEVVMYAGSKRGKVWLRGRWELVFDGATRMGRACGGGGANGEGAVPESGVKNGDVVGLRGPGENDDGAVSVNAL